MVSLQNLLDTPRTEEEERDERAFFIADLVRNGYISEANVELSWDNTVTLVLTIQVDSEVLRR